MKTDVSLIIPTYNERENIRQCLDGLVKAFSGGKAAYELIIVDDNSTDGTYETVKNYSGRNKRIRAFLRTGEKGIGSAIFFGMKKSSGTYLIPFMADLSDDPEDALRLYNKIKEGYDVVFTNRFKGKNRAYGYPHPKYYFNRLYNLMIATLFNLKYTDTSNAFKAVRKDIVDRLDIKCKGFEFTTELALKSYFRGKRFSEIPVTWNNREKGKQKSSLLKIGRGYLRVLLLLLNEKRKNKG